MRKAYQYVMGFFLLGGLLVMMVSAGIDIGAKVFTEAMSRFESEPLLSFGMFGLFAFGIGLILLIIYGIFDESA